MSSKGGILILKVKNRRVFISITIITLAFSGLYIFRLSNNNKTTKEASKTSVQLFEVKPQTVESYKKFSGSVKGFKEEALSPQMPTEVKSIKIKKGDIVKKGQVLIVLDSSSVDQQLSQTKQAYDSAKSQVENATSSISQAKAQLPKLNAQINSNKQKIKSIETEIKSNKEKLGQLNKDKENGDITAEDFVQGSKELSEKMNLQNQELTKIGMITSQLVSQKESIEKNLSSADTGSMTSQVEQVKKAYDSTLEAKESFTLKAPFDGYVTSLNAKVGEVPMGLNPPIVISDTSSLVLEVDVLDRDLDLVRSGSEYDVTLSDKNGKSVKTTGKIDSIVPVNDTEVKSHKIKVIIKNSSKIESGSFAEIHIPYTKKDNVLAIPKDALFRKKDSSYVYTVDNKNKVKKLDVTLGIENNDDIEITTGLKNGIKVISKGKNFVTENEIINIDRGDK